VPAQLHYPWVGWAIKKIGNSYKLSAITEKVKLSGSRFVVADNLEGEIA